MNRSNDGELLVILARSALILAADRPWDHVTLSDICADADISLVNCAISSVTKARVAAELDSLIDQAMLSGQTKVDRTQSVRDRLFDVLMGRFDAMQDNRSAWVSILHAEKSDMKANFARRARRVRSAAWALEAAGVTASDFRGASRAVALARILRLIESVWIEDGDELAKTMARLDQELRAAEEWAGRVDAFRGFFQAKPANEATL